MNIIDSQTHQVIRTFDGPRGIGKVAYSPDGRYLALGVRPVSIMDVKDGTLIRTIIGPYVDMSHLQPLQAQSIAFSPDSKTLAVIYWGVDKNIGIKDKDDKHQFMSAIVLYQVGTGEVVWNKPLVAIEGTLGRPMVNTPLIFSANGKSLVYGMGETDFAQEYPERKSSLVMLDAKTGMLQQSIDNIHMDMPTALAISHDGRFAATGTSTGVTDGIKNIKTNKSSTFVNKDPIRIWDIETGKLVK
ncbi:WD40 repeat domain-containing protein [Sulfuriferula nivalis]|uniref:WD40 repeat domain-containing protein n=1 Tax=Sulfuriferula nivalis TaxID=2675298 RepID=A0A809RG29_9PROT|nr:WD40 repeat domain-containing protein [Sulfuriferula nivalis]BBP00545.1 hypothetical protein SFSGTM_12530 [Sulfuriferula nivalis]